MTGTIEYSTGGYSLEEYYETNHVKQGKGNYTCEVCGKNINIGEPSATHKFYPEFAGPRTHVGKCEKKFLEDMRGEEEGDSKKLTKATSENQKEIEDEIITVFEGKEFHIHESSSQTKNTNKFFDLIEDNIYDIMDGRWGDQKFDPFKMIYETKLKTKITLEVYRNKINYNVEDISKK